jgi:hypothetical protein
MPASLPTTNTVDKAVDTFGMGTYDSQRDEEGDHGENSEKTEPEGESLPEDGGPLDPFGPDRLLSYPQTYTSQGKHASANVPGELDRPPSSRRINDDTIQPAVESVSQAKLPDDEDNPPARSDYYDKMTTGQGRMNNIWPTEDSGAYTSQEKTSDSALPTVNKNEETMDNFLGALGNYWSGTEIEDISGPQGFPTEDFAENVDYDRSDNQDGGKIMAGKNPTLTFLHSGLLAVSDAIPRLATDLTLVASLTKEFIQEFGKKDLTRRHVMAFLTERGRPQYLASDIIRCLKHDHKLVVPDVLDTFPIAKIASGRIGIAGVRDHIINLQFENIQDEDTSCVLGRCAADLAHVMIDLEKVEGLDG